MAIKSIYTMINEMENSGRMTKKEKIRIMKEIKKTKYLNSVANRGKEKDMGLVKNATYQVVKGFNKSDKFNTQVISHIANVNKITKPLLDNPNSIRLCINTYMTMCQKDGIRPSVSGLSLAIGVSRMTLLKWANGETRLQNQEVITQALQMIEVFVETSMETGKMNPVPALFLLKNNHNYHDESVIKIDNGVKELSADEIRKKYMEEMNIIDGEVIEKENDK